jgi:hypothetical protein
MSCLYFFFFSKGDYVWLDPKERGDFDVAIGACVKNSNSNQIQVVDDEGKVREPLKTHKKLSNIKMNNAL